jgi:hypothetical protein
MQKNRSLIQIQPQRGRVSRPLPLPRIGLVAGSVSLGFNFLYK